MKQIACILLLSNAALFADSATACAHLTEARELALAQQGEAAARVRIASLKAEADTIFISHR